MFDYKEREGDHEMFMLHSDVTMTFSRLLPTGLT